MADDDKTRYITSRHMYYPSKYAHAFVMDGDWNMESNIPICGFRSRRIGDPLWADTPGDYPVTCPKCRRQMHAVYEYREMPMMAYSEFQQGKVFLIPADQKISYKGVSA